MYLLNQQASRLVYGHHSVIHNFVLKAIHNVINDDVKLYKFINIISKVNCVINIIVNNVVHKY